MPLYEINDEARKHFLEFLSRTDLKGHEVPKFNRLMQILGTPYKFDRSDSKKQDSDQKKQDSDQKKQDSDQKKVDSV